MEDPDGDGGGEFVGEESLYCWTACRHPVRVSGPPPAPPSLYSLAVARLAGLDRLHELLEQHCLTLPGPARRDLVTRLLLQPSRPDFLRALQVFL